MKRADNHPRSLCDPHDLNGIPDRTMDLRMKIYQDYLKKTNQLTRLLRDFLRDGQIDQEEMPAHSQLERWLGFEYNDRSYTSIISKASDGLNRTARPVTRPSARKIKLFTGVSYENLRQEAATGGGQYVTSLAVLYGVPVEKHQAFGRLLQEKHGELFTMDLKEDNTAHLKAVAALNRALLADPIHH